MSTEKYAVALGMFDGVHLGHRAVLKSAVESPCKSVAVTFSFIPKKVGGYLMTAKEKEEKLLEAGIDEVFFLDFFEVKDMSPRDFLQFLSQSFNPQKICCGFNYRFGRKATGDTTLLADWCALNGVELFECPEVVSEGETVSSSLIKELIKNGDIKRANKLLGRPFGFTAEVRHGDQRGRTIGFPTINQLYPEDLVAPKCGVYHTLVTINGKDYNGVTNIGFRPTFVTDYVSAETFVLDFSGDCYGQQVRTQLVDYLREEQKFSSLEELQSAIRQNADFVSKHKK